MWLPSLILSVLFLSPYAHELDVLVLVLVIVIVIAVVVAHVASFVVALDV